MKAPGVGRLLRLIPLMTITAGLVAGADTAPPWLQQLANLPTPSYGKTVPAAVLLDENAVTVDAAGRVTSVKRYAVRVLLAEGRRYARGGETYISDTGKVNQIQGWLIQPSGEVKRYGKDKAFDVPVTITGGDMYNNIRYRMITTDDRALKGSVFGYESVLEDKSVFTQFEWYFQDRLPVLVSRFSLSLPPGWRAESVTHNHARLEPAVTGNTWSWELRDLQPIELETASPHVSSLAPRVAVSFFAPPGVAAGLGRSFAGWTDVSRWLSELSDPQSTPDDAISRKARELTAGARTEYERIQAIGRFVQKVRYVSIQTGVGRGGGYRPHPASEVFAKSYGDCKDKANLMRAMLQAVGISSYPLVIFSGDRTFVRPDWPSPQQFNHCILAARLGQKTQARSVVEHPGLGTLLIFDPTDEETPVGDLPEIEQDSLALLVAGDQGALLRMPRSLPAANRLEYSAALTLSPNGSIGGTIHEEGWGQTAANDRGTLHQKSQPEYSSMIEKRIAARAPGLVISRLQPMDDVARDVFSLDVDFTVPRYAQLVADRLMLFKPAVMLHRHRLVFGNPARIHPIALNGQAIHEIERIRLPAGFVVDELPAAVNIETSFGSFRAQFEVKDGAIESTRDLEVQSVILSAERYSEVRTFFERVTAVEEAQIVLAKK